MMEKRTRSSVLGGLLLILLGVAFLAYQVMPDQFRWLQIQMSWPLIVMGVGLFLLVFGLVVGEPGMAVPACIVAGIGGILYYQNLTGNWESWSYAWALIPGFVGLGTILTGILGGAKLRDSIEGGIWLIVISAVMFSIFASFLGGVNFFGPYWPVLLILLGVLVLVRNIIRR